MCYQEIDVYTVCAHSRVGSLLECQRQRARNELLRDAGCWDSFMLNIRSCRPVERTVLIYKFCLDCRSYYAGYDTNTVNAVLNYWAFKTFCNYSFSVPPSLVPVEAVFGNAVLVREELGQRRCELIALDKVWRGSAFETQSAWLQRLENARTVTLETAQKNEEFWARHRSRWIEWNARTERTLLMQPRATPPMSLYPSGNHGLSSVTERTEPQEAPAHSLPSQDTRVSRQVHLETLRKLCGDDSLGLPPTESKETPRPHTPGPGQREIVLGASAPPSLLSHDALPDSLYAALSATDFVSPARLRTRCLTAPSNNKQQGHPQADRDLDGEVLTDMGLNESPSTGETDPSTDPSMTSRFSVSKMDPVDPAELASYTTASSPSVTLAPADIDAVVPRTKSSLCSTEEAVPENGRKSVVIQVHCAPEIIAPQPTRHASPLRFVVEDGVSAAEQSILGES